MNRSDDKRLRRIASEFRNGLLSSKPSTQMCFVVSSSLGSYLHFCGYPCILTKGGIGKYEHFWLTLQDGTVLDPTADQFKKPDGSDMPTVYLGSKPEWYKES